jgi:hypothetical protein
MANARRKNQSQRIDIVVTSIGQLRKVTESLLTRMADLERRLTAIEDNFSRARKHLGVARRPRSLAKL